MNFVQLVTKCLRSKIELFRLIELTMDSRSLKKIYNIIEVSLFIKCFKNVGKYFVYKS